jgi:L-histidine Nalpha-methyltransferase
MTISPVARPTPLGDTRAPASLPTFAADVCRGLTGPGPKQLDSRYFYDELGSSLFEAISLLPEYGLTRADERILRTHAAEIVARVPAVGHLAELGSGSGKKTRSVLAALEPRGLSTYFPIDVSAAALARCQAETAAVSQVRVVPIEADYLDGLREVTSSRRDDRPLLLLFLGSTIGNLDRAVAETFLGDVRRALVPGDALLLGTDLVKPVPRLLAAYDDALGVTAAFNLNLLSRMNRELGAEFDLRRFEHQARWAADERRVEMHLVSRGAQAVRVRILNVEIRFREGESIWTESSHKYERSEPRAMAERAGFECVGQWIDEEWPFAETLMRAV